MAGINPSNPTDAKSEVLLVNGDDAEATLALVKEAVSKFGGIVDWKAHKLKTVERRKFTEQELDKAQEDVPTYRKLSQKNEEVKVKALTELNTAKRLIEEMKLNTEKVQTEKHQNNQNAELAKLQVEKVKQLDVFKAKMAEAISDLESAKEELEALRTDYVALITERDTTVMKAEKARAAFKEVEKTVQDLTIELIATKESLESAHAKHLEAEEGRLTAAMAKEQYSQSWEKELKEVVDEAAELYEQVLSAKQSQSKLDAAVTLLLDLKAELASYMESKMNRITNDESLRRTRTGTQAEKELEDVRLKIEKANEEVNLLKLAASSLHSELESEKAMIAIFKQKEGMTIKVVKCLEAEINEIELQLAEVELRETATREKMMDLHKQLPQSAEEANRVKSLIQHARKEFVKIKDESEQANAGASTMKSRLHAAEKEKEAAVASEKLALAAIKALQESEKARSSDDVSSPTGVKISLEEYYELSNRAHEVEEQANLRVAGIIAQVEAAKELQLRCMEKLQEVDQVVAQRKEALKVAIEKAEKAAEGKSNLEQELRKWRAENGQSRKESESGILLVPESSSQSPRSTFKSKLEKSWKSNVVMTQEPSNYVSLPTANYASPPQTSTPIETDTSSPDTWKPAKKKKHSFFPRVITFLAKRKAHSSE